jgi:hypothetical protein
MAAHRQPETMRSVLLACLLPLAAVPARAEAIMVLLSRSPFGLVGESVTVGVARRMSMVEGRYEFRYVPRFDRGARTDHVTFEFPVLVPKETDSLEEISEITQMKLRVGDVEFQPVDYGPWPDSEAAPLQVVPEDIKVAILSFSVPRAMLQDRVTVTVSYFQPHYRIAGREVAAYLPLLPDFEALKNELLFSSLDFTVAFEAVDAVRLHRLSTNRSVADETPGRIVVHPTHRENIAVAVEAAEAPGGGPATPANGETRR